MMRSKSFFKFDYVKLFIGVLFIIIVFGTLGRLFGNIYAIPCDIENNVEESSAGLCTIDPVAMNANTVYFGSSSMDTFYVFIYLIVMAIAIPYTISCAVVWTVNYFLDRAEKKPKKKRR